MRAILGLPLGEHLARGHSAMLNLLGEMPDRRRLLREESLFLHDYGKEPRPDRKLGHCTSGVPRRCQPGPTRRLRCCAASIPVR